MKVCLVAHGYPPELVGGTEKTIQGLARELARSGHDVVVVAGSIAHEAGFRTSEATDRHSSGEGTTIRVHRIHRADLYFDHWQKSLSARVGESFRALLREVRPDVVHVHHWIRLTRDLVRCAALEGVPAAATLHDLWTTCLITFRVRPDDHAFCHATRGPHPCLDCAAQVPPRTPWVSRENLFMAFAERRADLVRELALARAVIVPSRAHAVAVGRFLGLTPDALSLRVVPHGRDLALARATPPPAGTDQPLVLGAWGHLHPIKGQDLVLRAIRRLPEPGRVRLHLAGGESQAGFADEVRRLAQGLDVVLHGPYAAEELDRHPVGAVHAMVSGSRAHESWGLVVDEALALGIPMVLPRSGAYAERLEEGAGVLFYEPNDEASLAAVLARLLASPELAGELRERLPGAAGRVPTLEEHARRLLAVYSELVEAGPPPRPDDEWWRARMQAAAEADWDESLARTPAPDLGLSPAPVADSKKSDDPS